MAPRTKKKSATAAKSRTRSSKKAAASKPSPAKQARDIKTEERFKRDLIVRGEAAYPDEQGRLPSEATHEIVRGTEREGELPEVKRRLYKIF